MNYTPAPRASDSNTSGYAYFKRDNRRNFGAEIAVKPTKALPAPESPNSELPPRPGKRHAFQKSAEQPPSAGYFSIVNCE